MNQLNYIEFTSSHYTSHRPFSNLIQFNGQSLPLKDHYSQSQTPIIVNRESIDNSPLKYSNDYPNGLMLRPLKSQPADSITRYDTNYRDDRIDVSKPKGTDIRYVPPPPVNNIMYHPSRYKIELCFQFEETGKCDFGNRCLYAHGKHELRPCTYRHSKFKTELCKAFHTEGFCSFGYRCCFIHVKPDADSLLKLINAQQTIQNSWDDGDSNYIWSDLSYDEIRKVLMNMNDFYNEFNLLPFDSHYPRLPSFVKLCSRNDKQMAPLTYSR